MFLDNFDDFWHVKLQFTYTCCEEVATKPNVLALVTALCSSIITVVFTRNLCTKTTSLQY